MNTYQKLHYKIPCRGLMHIFFKNIQLATIIFSFYKSEGINFFTPEEFSQQLGYMKRPKGYEIPPHDHNPVPRTIEWTQETVIIRTGRVRLDLYAPHTQSYLASLMLHSGDIALLAHGGHGFYMEEDCEMVEVKQGPYAGDADKTRFPGVSDERVTFLEPA